MPGRVQADGGRADAQGLAVRQGLQLDAPQPGAQHPLARCAAQISGVAATGMVGMGVRDDGARYGPPGVDVEIARRAVQPFRPEDDQVTVSGFGHDVPF